MLNHIMNKRKYRLLFSVLDSSLAFLGHFFAVIALAQNAFSKKTTILLHYLLKFDCYIYFPPKNFMNLIFKSPCIFIREKIPPPLHRCNLNHLKYELVKRI